MESKKTIFQYDNYREFLKDFYLQSKVENKKFSFQLFARLAGFKSKSFLKLVMNGESNISLESMDRLTKAMKLNGEESIYFKNLVHLNQARNSIERERYAKEILRSRSYKKIHPLSAAQFRYYAKWYFVIVRGLVGLPDFKEDPEWIGQRIIPNITSAEAKQALEELQLLKLIERDSKNKLVQSHKTVATANEVTSSSVAQFHREMLKYAAESIDRIPRERRDISALTLGVSEKTAASIKEMIQKFRYDLAELASRDESPDMVYQINMQVFPMAELPKLVRGGKFDKSKGDS